MGVRITRLIVLELIGLDTEDTKRIKRENQRAGKHSLYIQVGTPAETAPTLIRTKYGLVMWLSGDFPYMEPVVTKTS